jgi:hypothetical protein
LRRPLAAGAAAAALVVPATSGADGAILPAQAAKGRPFSVSFTVERQGGRPVAVKRVRFRGLPISCDQGEYLLGSRVNGKIPVVDRRFDATAIEEEPAAEARLMGRFVKRRKVKGRVRVDGSFTYDRPSGGDRTITDCAGARRYTAS